MKRNASAVWNGGIKDGKGTISTDSGVLANAQYSFSTRFEDGIGTNPEELIAAAHAACFTMALSAQLEKAGRLAELDPPKNVVVDHGEAQLTLNLPRQAVSLLVFEWR